MAPDIDVQQVKLCEVLTLHNVCREIYSQNFYTHWNEDGLQLYMNKVFGIERLKEELSAENIQYYMAFLNQAPVAFMKINLLSNLPGFDIKKGLELDKIYISPKFKGMKIGLQLLNLAFDIGRKNKKEVFWLSVIDSNSEAISFYTKAGFKFHSKTKVNYPKFKEELKGMWRMYVELSSQTFV
jgi:diamine N-acetyltransferase